MSDSFRNPTVDEVFEELLIYFAHEAGWNKHQLTLHIKIDSRIDVLGKLEPEMDWVGFYDHFGVECPDRFIDGLTADSTVRDLCYHLSKRIQVPSIPSTTILGKSCQSAGLFLEIKQKLIALGENGAEISPSTNLEPFLVRHHDLFRTIRWYSPGKLSALHIRNRLAGWGALSFVLIAIASLIYGGVTSKFAPDMPSIAMMAVVALILSISTIAYATIHREKFERASFDGLTDFRSLVDALLDRPPSRPNKYKLARGNPQ